MIRLFSYIITLALLQPSGYSLAQAQQPHKTKFLAYDRGFVDEAVPIDWFVNADLVPACESLKSNNLKAAEELFSAAIRKDPNQPALYVGYLQAIPQKREAPLAEYRADVRRAPTAVNHFKLGLLATYLRMDLKDIDLRPLHAQ